MKRVLVILFLFSLIGMHGLGCKENIQEDQKPNVRVTQESKEEKDEGGVKFGPKTGLRPSINMSTGEFSMMPDMSFGPHFEF